MPASNSNARKRHNCTDSGTIVTREESKWPTPPVFMEGLVWSEEWRSWVVPDDQATTPRYHDIDTGKPVPDPHYPAAGSSAWWRRVVKHEDPALAEYQRLRQDALDAGRNNVYVLWVNMYDYWADISCLEAGVMDR
jgi:hypothetical protein